jgi:hypothetical protein
MSSPSYKPTPLAFSQTFCHAKWVKKVSLSCLFFFSIVFFFSLFYSVAEAADGTAQKNDYCETALGAAEAHEVTCAGGLYCNTSPETEARVKEIKGGGFLILAGEGVCYPAATVKGCTCADGNESSRGINCPGKPPISCANADDICRNTPPDFIGPEDRIADPGLPIGPADGVNDPGYTHTKLLAGISCEKPHINGCHCDNPDKPGQSNISCDNGGKSACANATDICRNTPPDFIGPDDRIKFSINGSKRLAGISCEPPSTQCHCEKENQLGSGNNKVVCPGASDTFCANPDLVCLNAAPDFKTVPDTLLNQTVKGPTGELAIRGVSCEKAYARCTCVTPNISGSGKNKIQCFQGPNEQDTFCSSSGQACIPQTDPTLQADLSTIKDPIFNGANLKGIKCEDRQAPVPSPTPTVPPVPPPPCADGKMGADGVCTSFMTAFGAIDTNVQGFVLRLFALLLSISGGIAILLIIRAGYLILTSAGNPERVKNGREQLIAAIVGLLFIIFSVVILETITGDILHAPDFVTGAPTGTKQKGAGCDANGNSQCQYPLTCVTVGTGRAGTCQ